MLGLLNFFEVTREGWISPQDGLYYCQKDKNCKNKKKIQVVLSYLAKNAKLNVDSLLTKDPLLCSWSVPS